MRRILVLAAVLILLGAIGVGVLLTLGPTRGGLQNASDRLEDWIGSQVVGVANSYLVPELAYTGLDYEAPGMVRLEGVTLTAPDGTEILSLGEMAVRLAEVPRIGEPITIEALVLTSPTINLVREVGPEGNAGFRGLSPIVERSPNNDSDKTDQDVEENFRLSNVLRLRSIEIDNGSLQLDMGDGSPPMAISGLTTVINAAPDDEGEPGFYDLDIDTAIGPLLNLSLVGEFSLDTFLARVASLRVHGELTDESASALPPALQQLRQAYGATGTIDAQVSGEVLLTDPMSGNLQFQTDLNGFSISGPEYQLPIDSVRLAGMFSGGTIDAPEVVIEMLEGRLNAGLNASLTETGMPAQLTWTIEGFKLQNLLAAGAQNKDSRIAGLLNTSGSATTTLQDAMGGLAGKGDLHVHEGRLLVLPGLTQLASLMNIAIREGESNHTIDAAFLLGPTGAEVTESEVHTEFLVARGTGTIGFDGALDLSVNAGPMEKLQSLLGGLGEALGNITDRLVKYRIKGTVAEPQVSVSPLGIGG